MDAESRPFYQPGGALPLDSRAYVHRAADDELFAYLMRGDYCSILTSRQMGKSSLIARTSARLREAGVTTCVIDLSSMSDSISDPEKWYFAFALKVGRALGHSPRELAEQWSSSEWPSPAQRWDACIERLLIQAESECQSFRLAVFLDEIDATREMEFKDGFFAMIRSAYNRRPTEPVFGRLTFCLVGSARPTDLIADPHLTPFNIGRRIELTDFSEEEARALVSGMDRSEAEGISLLRRVLYWTGGHPYLTHRLCMSIAESASACGTNEVDGLAESLFFSTGSREQDDNLAFVGHRVLTSCDSERDKSRLLSTYDVLLRGKRVRDNKADPVLGVLHMAGLVGVSKGALVVRNRIYARVFDRTWVRENMPDAQLRMVRAAYWRAALRWAGLAGVMSLVALYALVQRRSAIRDEAIANQLAHVEHTLLMQSMQALWDHADLAQMEANLRNTPIHERNFEWRYWLRQTHQNLLTLADPEANGGRVAATVFAPDGSWLATSGKFPFIDIWDPKTGKLLTRLPEPACPYTLSLDVSPDGRRLVSGGDREVARVWDTRSWRSISRLDMGTNLGEVTCVRFSPDGRLIAASSVQGRGTRVFDAASGKLRNVFGTDLAWAVAFDPASSVLAMAGDYNRITLWPLGGRTASSAMDFSSPKRAAGVLSLSASDNTDENFAIDCLAFSPDGRRLAAGSKDNSIRIWDMQSRQIVSTIRDSENGVSSVAFTPSGNEIVGVGLDRTVRVWNTKTWDEVMMVPAHARWVNSVSVSRTGLLATASDDGLVKIWPLDFAPKQSHWPSSVDWVAKPITLDGVSRIPAFTANGGLGWLDPESRTWTPLAIPPLKSPLVGLGTTDHGRVLEAIDRRGHVLRWSGDRLIQDVPLPTDLGVQVVSVALSPDGTQALLGLKAGQVVRINLLTRSYQFLYSENSTLDPRVAWAPGSRPIWSAGLVGHRRLYIGNALFSGQPVSLQLESSGGLFVSNDGRQLVVGSVTEDSSPDPTLIDLDSLQKRRLVGHAIACAAADFSPDGSRIVTVGADNTIRLWDARDAVNLQIWQLEVSRPVLFSPDGNHIIVWRDGKIDTLDAASPGEIARWTKAWVSPN